MFCPETFPWAHHARMLADTVRLQTYADAMAQTLRKNDVVVDVGTGTGILAAIAGRHTAGVVHAIEYRKDVAELAEKLVASSGLSNVRIHQGRSYDLRLDPAPEVLITETMGLVGPEEAIVEICADLVARHPSIREVIPSRLAIFSEPLLMAKPDTERERLITAVELAGTMSDLVLNPFADALRALCFNEIRFGNLAGSESLGSPAKLVDYELGVTRNSEFEAVIPFAMPFVTGQVAHLYFEATLSHDVLLSTRHSAPMTHWLHSFVKRPERGTSLRVRYDRKTRAFEVNWS